MKNEQEYDQWGLPKQDLELNPEDLALIKEAGIHNLSKDKDGVLHGSCRGSSWWPNIHYLTNIRIENGEVKADVTHTVDDIGKVI